MLNTAQQIKTYDYTQGFSMGNPSKEYFIFASDKDLLETIGMLQYLGIPYKKLLGSYVMESTGRQIIEDSYLVSANHYDAIESAGLICNQESILWLSEQEHYDQGKRAAALVYPNCHKDYVPLGYFQSVDKETALANDYWTYDADADIYYITE